MTTPRMNRLIQLLFGKRRTTHSATASSKSNTDDGQTNIARDVMALCSEQRFPEAEELIAAQAARGLPTGTVAMLRGNVALTQKRCDVAIIHFRHALNQNRRDLAVFCNLAAALLQLGMPWHSQRVLDEAEKHYSKHASLTLLRAETLLQSGQNDAGIAVLLDLLTQSAPPPRALSVLITEWLASNNSQRACDFLLAWLQQHDDASSHALLGVARYNNHELTASEHHYRTALARDQRDAQTWDNLGATLQDLGRLDEAITCYERSMALNPSNPVPRWHRSLAYLLDGRFDLGWPDYELRTLNNDLQTGAAAFPRWTGGAAPDQTVLIFGEQGLGDEIMFASCLPDAIARVKHAVVHCHPKLETIFRRSFPASTVTSGALLDALALYPDDAPLIDAALPSGSLPYVLNRDQKHFPAAQPYLRADPQDVVTWRQRLAELGPGLKIGLSWRGGTTGTRQSLRSLQLDDWLPVLRQPNTHFINLQYSDVGAEITQLAQRRGIHINHWQDAIDDYDQTAALVSALNLVISVQTAVIHLSGALGQRTWVLVPACPEWRYQRHGTRMPWYANVTLYRQTVPLDWRETIERVATDLALLPSATPGINA